METPAPAISSLKSRRHLKGHYGKITALHWCNDSLVTAGQDGNLLVWNPISSHKVQSIHLKSSYVMSVGVEQSKGNLIACGGLDNLCTVYPRNNPKNCVEMASHEGFLSCCRFLSEQQLVTSSGDSTCILWDVTTAQPISTFAEHSADAVHVDLKDRNVFASCSVDQTVKIWDIRDPKQATLTFCGHLGDVNGVEFMPTETNCFGTCSQDGTVRLFDIRAYNELMCFGTPVPMDESGIPTDGYTSLAFSKSGRLIFCGHADNMVVAFDTLKGTTAFTLAQAHDANGKHVSCVGVSPAGDALCSGNWDGTAKIWA